MRKYSMIIPTMWQSDLINNICSNYPSSEYIDEIIIIDNDKSLSPNFSHEKVRILKEEDNIYVNPAWNKGVNLSKNDFIIISNDDVYIEDIDFLFKEIDTLDFDIMCIDVKFSNKKSCVEITKLNSKSERLSGYGSFFIMKKEKYIHIPEDIKIWYGDDILFDYNENRYCFSVPVVKFYTSKTLNNPKNRSRNFKKIIADDQIAYNKFKRSR